MSQALEHFRMETNFDGLIQLLAKHLYPEPDVFIRELIQNSHDAIQRRMESEGDLAGKIDLALDGGQRILTIHDNGIGMDRADVKQFLSVIGSSGTLKAIQDMQAEGRDAARLLIGQFGIGFLSAFLVAEKVVVRTRKVGSPAAFRWENTGSLDCELYADELTQPGSTIALQIGRNHAYLMEERRLKDAIRKYCDFIPFPIYLNGWGPVNELDIPFYRTHWESDQERLARYEIFVRRRYPDDPLDVIPVEIEGEHVARGVLYISDRSIPDIETSGTVDVLIRRMFIKSEDTNLLPKWAKFVRGVIDSPSLEPIAARDNYKLEHPSVAYITHRLGEIIVDRLTHLAVHEPQKFKRINRWHHYYLKGMACVHEDFFRQVGGLLLFETNKGQLSLEACLTKNAALPELGHRVPLYYFTSSGAATQFNRLAEARGWTIINASHIFEEDFLRKYSDQNPTVHLVRLDTTDDPSLFQPLPTEEEERFRPLQVDLQGHLEQIGIQNVRVRLRRFPPDDIPAVVIMSQQTEQDRRMRDLLERVVLTGASEEIAEEMLEENPSKMPLYLNLNADNRLIQKLSGLDRRSGPVRQVLTGVYNCAIMHSHNLLTQHNTQVMHDHLRGLLESLIDNQETMRAAASELEQERQKVLDFRSRETESQARRPDHVRLFMMTPFDREYMRLEEALREIFETHPYYFEVQLARDYIFEAGLLDNVREHIDRSHGFLADVSTLNANVMFELGAVMLRQDERPVFTLRSRQSGLEVPADLREKLRIEYGSLDNTHDELIKDIRGNLEREGRIVHDQLRALMTLRKKRFLSRKFLESAQVRLERGQIESIMRHYSTVEDFLDADPAVISRQTAVPNFIVSAIRGELSFKDSSVN